MNRFVAVAFLVPLTLAGWCDEWGSIEWSDEFDGDSLDTSKWSVVCNDLSKEGCEVLPFKTSANGAECRSARCVPEAVTVSNG